MRRRLDCDSFSANTTSDEKLNAIAEASTALKTTLDRDCATSGRYPPKSSMNMIVAGAVTARIQNMLESGGNAALGRPGTLSAPLSPNCSGLLVTSSRCAGGASR